MQEFQIIGTRTLTEEISIKISPKEYFPDKPALMMDAQTLHFILRNYLPSRTYQYLKDMLTKE